MCSGAGPSAGMGAEPPRSGRSGRLPCPRVRYAAWDKRTPPPPLHSPPSLKTLRSPENSLHAFVWHEEEGAAATAAEGAALQGSGVQPSSAEPVAGGPVGEGRQEARHCHFFFTTPAGVSSYSTALDLVKPTAGAQFLAEKLLSRFSPLSFGEWGRSGSR